MARERFPYHLRWIESKNSHEGRRSIGDDSVGIYREYPVEAPLGDSPELLLRLPQPLLHLVALGDVYRHIDYAKHAAIRIFQCRIVRQRLEARSVFSDGLKLARPRA